MGLASVGHTGPVRKIYPGQFPNAKSMCPSRLMVIRKMRHPSFQQASIRYTVSHGMQSQLIYLLMRLGSGIVVIADLYIDLHSSTTPFSRLIFGLQGHERPAGRARDMSLIRAGDAVVGISYTQGPSSGSMHHTGLPDTTIGNQTSLPDPVLDWGLKRMSVVYRMIEAYCGFLSGWCSNRTLKLECMSRSLP